MHPHHYLHLVALVLFLVGDALHVLVQVDDLARKGKTTRKAIFSERWVSIIVRGSISTAFFLLWLQGQLDDLITATGISIPASIDKILDMQVSGALALLAGFAFDSAIGYIPFLSKIGVPPPIVDTGAPTP